MATLYFMCTHPKVLWVVRAWLCPKIKDRQRGKINHDWLVFMLRLNIATKRQEAAHSVTLSTRVPKIQSIQLTILLEFQAESSFFLPLTNYHCFSHGNESHQILIDGTYYILLSSCHPPMSCPPLTVYFRQQLNTSFAGIFAGSLKTHIITAIILE